MNKRDLANKFSNIEDKYFVAKILDQLELVNKRRKVVNTEFLDLHKKGIVIEIMKFLKQPYLLFGGIDGAERQMLILFTQDIDEQEVTTHCRNSISIIQIHLPNMLHGKYFHRDYLSGIMKTGIKREKCGDILVNNEGAYYIVQSDISDFVLDNLKQLTRFKKANIEKIERMEMNILEKEKEELKIIVPSERLDSIVSELAHTSRNQANIIIKENKVLINDMVEIKNSKMLKAGDIITIRGKGKFQFTEIVGESSKGKKILKILKYT